MAQSHPQRQRLNLELREREAARKEREAEARRAVPREPALAGRGDWREAVIGFSGLNLLAGIWLIISPFVLGYSGGDAIWNPIVFGAIVGVIALVRMLGAFQEAWLSWINAAIGVWLFISAFWLADSGQATWNTWILGIIVFVLAIWSETASEEGRRVDGDIPRV